MKTVVKVLLMALFGLLLVGCGGEKNVNEQKQKETLTQEQSAHNQQTEQVVNEDKQIYIPGIEASDIKLNLEKYGFSFTGPRPLSKEVGGGYLDDGKVRDPDTGVELSCTISAENPLKINSVTFRTDGTLVAGTISPKIYLATAEGFLGFCATLPYDGAEPEKAKTWVIENIKNVKTGQPIYTTIGSVEYRLAGNEYFTTLSIKPEESPE